MQAMIFNKAGQPLKEQNIPIPRIAEDQLLVKVDACGVCRTDLHIIDAELTQPKLPLILGHEIVGKVEQVGSAVLKLKAGDRVGIPWLGYTCGRCLYCLNDKENLCDNALFTGYTSDGGYAEYTVANEKYCLPLSNKYTSVEMAPLLCAGLIGWRSYKLAGNFERIGIYGFGVAAHILTRVAQFQGKEVYAFTRAGDKEGQANAKRMGATWAGDANETAKDQLDAAIIFAPVGDLVLSALKSVRKGGAVVCGGIHMSDIPAIPYEYLWEERSIKSVANLTRADAKEFLEIADKVDLRISTQTYALREANQALADFKAGKTNGAAVLSMKG